MTLQRLRAFRGLTQKEVAVKLGVSQQYYSFIERGERPANEKHLKILAEVLEFPADYIRQVLEAQKAKGANEDEN